MEVSRRVPAPSTDLPRTTEGGPLSPDRRPSIVVAAALIIATVAILMVVIVGIRAVDTREGSLSDRQGRHNGLVDAQSAHESNPAPGARVVLGPFPGPGRPAVPLPPGVEGLPGLPGGGQGIPPPPDIARDLESVLQVLRETAETGTRAPIATHSTLSTRRVR